jgi:hypothetical protein
LTDFTGFQVLTLILHVLCVLTRKIGQFYESKHIFNNHALNTSHAALQKSNLRHHRQITINYNKNNNISYTNNSIFNIYNNIGFNYPAKPKIGGLAGQPDPNPFEVLLGLAGQKSPRHAGLQTTGSRVCRTQAHGSG